MESFVKIAIVAVIAALCTVVVKKQTPELGLILALLAGVMILTCSVPAFRGAKEMMERFNDIAELSPAVLTPVTKTVGIAVLTKVSAEFCRDAKEGGIAAFVELAGASGALMVCLPLMESVLSMVVELL